MSASDATSRKKRKVSTVTYPTGNAVTVGNTTATVAVAVSNGTAANTTGGGGSSTDYFKGKHFTTCEVAALADAYEQAGGAKAEGSSGFWSRVTNLIKSAVIAKPSAAAQQRRVGCESRIL